MPYSNNLRNIFLIDGNNDGLLYSPMAQVPERHLLLFKCIFMQAQGNFNFKLTRAIWGVFPDFNFLIGSIIEIPVQSLDIKTFGQTPFCLNDHKFYDNG